MTATEIALDKYHPDSHKRFLSDTKGHAMTVLHDDGLYRHLLFRQPESGWCWFEIVTWPGCLTIRGDMGTYTFSRIEDMFQFFAEGYINPGYWGEKVIAADRRCPIREYSERAFRQRVAEYWGDRKDDYDPSAQAEIWQQVEDEVLYEAGFEETARGALNSFQHPEFEFVDVWEWDFTEYTVQYLWCCHAIRWAISQYRAVSS